MAIIRPATLHDLPQLRALLGRKAERARDIAIRLERAHTAILVAENEGRLVGYIEMRVVRRGRRERDGWLRRLACRLLNRPRSDPDAIMQPMRIGVIEHVSVPSTSNKDITTALVQSGIRWLQSQEIFEVQTTVPLDDEAPQSFYRELGFEPMRYLVRKML